MINCSGGIRSEVCAPKRQFNESYVWNQLQKVRADPSAWRREIGQPSIDPFAWAKPVRSAELRITNLTRQIRR